MGRNTTPPLVCVVGKKDSGKTGVVVRLVAELLRRGRRVMTIKHGHGFDLDTVGSDSWRHRHEGGSLRVAMAGPGEIAVLGDWGPGGELDATEIAARFLFDAEIVIAEGYKGDSLPKIEVYRSETGRPPVYRPGLPDAGSFLAMVTDRDDLAWPLPVLGLGAPDTIGRLADLVEDRVLRREVRGCLS